VNVYYQPEAFGLTIVAELENGGSYEFDTIVVWRRDSGQLLWATDAGCSCPTPFEDVGLNDLCEFDADAIRREVQERSEYGYATAEERAKFLRKVARLKSKS
jgi:hypothetical protein